METLWANEYMGVFIMAIPTTDFLSAPYDDEVLAYDYETRQYYMKLDASLGLTGIDLIELWQTPENAEFYLKLISNVIYTRIYSFKDEKYRERMAYYLSHSAKARKALKSLIMDTVHYNHSGGGFMTAYQTGINLHEMKTLRIEPEQFLSPIANEIMKNNGLQTRYFKYDFDVVASTAGSEW
jgi:hypothetical protein